MAKKTTKRPTTKKKTAVTSKSKTKKAAPKKTKASTGRNTTVKAKTSSIKKSSKAPSTGSRGLKIGDMVPSITRAATGGKSLSLSDFKGRKVVLYFYPKDDTPGCTLEGQDFTRLNDQFKAANCEILGVSRDPVASHEKFCSKFAFTFTLLSDEDEQLCKSFDVIKDKNMYGKIVRGIERSTFVIDRDGRLSREWRKVSVDGHAAEVLAHVKSLP